MKRRFPAFVAGKRQENGEFDTIFNPYDGAPVSEVVRATHTDMDAAIECAFAARAASRARPAHERAALCDEIARVLRAREAEFAELITRESGKPIRYARAEVARAVSTFELGAAVARTLGGEVMPADVSTAGGGDLLLYRRVPRGVIGAIAPFNFPLNLVAHKVAPALAVGAPIVLKPSHQAPGAALLLTELIEALGIPAGGISTLHALPDVAEQLASDPRIALLSFTGSDVVGFRLKQLAAKKQVLLELGGNAPAIVDASADLDDAVPRLVEASFANAGQICIKAQRLLVHTSRYEEFTARFVEATRAVFCGDPLDERTMVGPLIEQKHVDRVLLLVKEAEAAGARVLTGGGVSGRVMEPTVLTDVPPQLRVYSEEVFGPVTILEPFSDFEQALARANATRFGLQASVFTRELERALRAFEALEYGSVLVNEAPTFRVDNYPYGGTKDSGIGREGVRFAAEEYTEPRVLVLRAPSGKP
jgi:acyl-CoA reductase-like NAD-dependent aldehyde dehydrogenase